VATPMVLADLALEEPFRRFGVVHLLTMAATLLMAVGVPVWAKRRLQPDQQLTVGVVLGAVVASSYAGWVVLELLAGRLRIDDHLPLHLCWLANLALPLAMTCRWPRLTEIVYFWGIGAGLQATITPTLETAFPLSNYVRYVVGHNLMLVTLTYACVVYRFRPRVSGIWAAFFAGNALALVACGVNVTLDANYLFLCEKPRRGTLFDHMGPWPWYILSGEGLVLLHFVAAYVPFWILGRCGRAGRVLRYWCRPAGRDRHGSV